MTDSNDTTLSDAVHPHHALLGSGVVYFDDATREHYLCSYEDWADLAAVGDYSLWCSKHSHPFWICDEPIQQLAADHWDAVESEGRRAYRNGGSVSDLRALLRSCSADDFDDHAIRTKLSEHQVRSHFAAQRWSDQDWKDHVGAEVRRRLNAIFADLFEAEECSLDTLEELEREGASV